MSSRPSAVVIGGGVIGQVYASRLGAAGIDVTLVTRGETTRRLHEQGVTLIRHGERKVSRCRVIDSTELREFVNALSTPVDLVLVAVRADQMEPALASAKGIPTRTIATMANLAGDPRNLLATTEPDRGIIFAFPGVGGRRTPDGVKYHEIAQQKTTVGATAKGSHEPLVAMLRSADFAVDVVGNMPAWLATHAVFIAGIGAYILIADDAGAELGAKRSAVAEMVQAVSDGFRALRKSSITVVPRSLNIIFSVVPRVLSVPYWQRMLRTDVGRLSIAPHIRATRTTEFPVIVANVNSLVGNDAPALTALFRKAGL